MSGAAWVDPRIERVRAADLRAYLLGRGWTPQPYPSPKLWVFAGPDDDDGVPILQVLPSSERLRDFRVRAEELVAALGAIEGRPAADVLTDVLAPASANGASRPAPSRAAPGE